MMIGYGLGCVKTGGTDRQLLTCLNRSSMMVAVTCLVGDHGKMASVYFPEASWGEPDPRPAGLDPTKLSAVRRWLDETWAPRPYRVAVVRHGHLAALWCRGCAPDTRRPMASAAKSVYSSLLGIAIAEERIASLDSRLVAYYPEAMDVPPGTGPKDGRHAFEKDRAITFRQLISNTSGYMKPGEHPGEVFHYQTFGMNVVAHAIAKVYGLYDAADPARLPGLPALIDEKLREPIGADWGYAIKNFSHAEGARIGIWGNYTDLLNTPEEMARLGWLWCQQGRWRDRQVIPADYMRDATRTASTIRAHCPPEQWQYGYAFWTNDAGEMTPGLPRDAFAAMGAQQNIIWVCPSLQLLVVNSLGPVLHSDDPHERVLPQQLARIVDACR